MEMVRMSRMQSNSRIVRNRWMKLIGLIFLVIPCLSLGQDVAPSGAATTTGPCSLANTGRIGTVTCTCGIGTRQGEEILKVLNTILANQLAPGAVMKKLDEILHAVNPNLPPKTYFCDGQWRTAGPSATAAFDVSIGGRRHCVQGDGSIE
jgi:hypothetical protein